MEKSIKIIDWENNEFLIDENGLTYQIKGELGSGEILYHDKIDELIKLIIEYRFKYSKSFYRTWKDVKMELPKETGRYWCYIKEQNDLGASHFESNCAFDFDSKIWSENLKIVNVLFWTELADRPI